MSLLGFRAASALAPLAALAVACGGGSDAMQKQVDQMHNDLVKLRADNAALTERVEALETGKRAPRGDAAGAGDRPNLDVVKMTPEGDVSDDPDADNPRPVVKVTGAAGSVSEKASGGPKRDYDEALELYRAKKYDKAIDAFGMFAQRYPSDANAEGATFLRGEALFAKADYRRAAEQYETFVSKFPKGAKAPDALQKLAQCYTRLGDKAKADDAKQRLANYPTKQGKTP